MEAWHTHLAIGYIENKEYFFEVVKLAIIMSRSIDGLGYSIEHRAMVKLLESVSSSTGWQYVEQL